MRIVIFGGRSRDGSIPQNSIVWPATVHLKNLATSIMIHISSYTASITLLSTSSEASGFQGVDWPCRKTYNLEL